MYNFSLEDVFRLSEPAGDTSLDDFDTLFGAGFEFRELSEESAGGESTLHDNSVIVQRNRQDQTYSAEILALGSLSLGDNNTVSEACSASERLSKDDF